MAGAQPGPPLEGTLISERPTLGGGLELEMDLGTNRARVVVQNPAGMTPILASRIKTPGRAAAGWSQIKVLTGFMAAIARTVADLGRMGAAGQHAVCVADLAGQVLAASPNGRCLIFGDGTGAMLMQLARTTPPAVAGAMITVQGNCTVEGARAIFGDPPLVDNDGLHAMTERFGVIYLTAGRHPLRVDWFNAQYPYGLEVNYEGPGLRRHRIPDAALSRQETDPATGQQRWIHGLNYRCYEGNWLRVPEFEALTAAKEGKVPNFDTGVFTRPDNVGLEFAGCVEVARNGIYTFSTVSDDGSLIFMNEKPTMIEVTGTNAVPTPRAVAVRQGLSEGNGGWSRVEGTVTFASEQHGRVDLELSSDTGRMRVEVADGSGISLPSLLRGRIRVTGVCLAARTPDGQTVAGALLAAGINQIQFWNASAAEWSGQPPVAATAVAAVSGRNATHLPVLSQVDQIKRLTREQWRQGYPVRTRGVVTTALHGGFFIEDSTWSIYVRWRPPTDLDAPRVGDYWEVEGKTFAEFAPNIQASHALRLDSGVLPEPLRPAWDQLNNGSLDTKYVELQGIITAVNSSGATLLTRSGKIGLELVDMPERVLRQYENALVRARGCVIPVRDVQTQRVEPGRIRLSNASIAVDEPAPNDPFSAPLEHATDLSAQLAGRRVSTGENRRAHPARA